MIHCLFVVDKFCHQACRPSGDLLDHTKIKAHFLYFESNSFLVIIGERGYNLMKKSQLFQAEFIRWLGF